MTLHANGIKVAPTITISGGERYLVEASSDNLLPNWYRIYSDGWCEQGGIATILQGTTQLEVTILKTYKNTNFNAQSNTCLPTELPSFPYGAIIPQVKDVNKIVLHSAQTGTDRRVYWETKGFIAEESE